jgi:hypothetical protein
MTAPGPGMGTSRDGESKWHSPMRLGRVPAEV